MANNCFVGNAFDRFGGSPILVVAESGMGKWESIFSDGDLEDDHECTVAYIIESNTCIGSSST